MMTWRIPFNFLLLTFAISPLLLVPLKSAEQISVVVLEEAGSPDEAKSLLLSETVIFPGQTAKFSLRPGSGGNDTLFYARAFRRLTSTLAPLGEIFEWGQLKNGEDLQLEWSPPEGVGEGNYVLQLSTGSDKDANKAKVVGVIGVEVLPPLLPELAEVSNWYLMGKFDKISNWLTSLEIGFESSGAPEDPWSGLGFFDAGDPKKLNAALEKLELQSGQTLIVPFDAIKIPVIARSGSGWLVHVPAPFFENFPEQSESHLQLVEILKVISQFNP